MSAPPDIVDVVEADLTWTGAAFDQGIRIAVDAAGRIADVGRLERPPTRRLTGRALLPGFVNAHSHAFQRGLRGRGETFPGTAGSFWTWREAMYDLVERLTPELAYASSRQAFGEMLAAGITTVGEFHYVHHATDARGWELDEAVVRAARDVGIRLVLLQTCYLHGGIGSPLVGGQRRFDGVDLDTFVARLEALEALLDTPRLHRGVAAHSVRAVTPDELRELDAVARRLDLPLHMHLEEQPAELEACRAAHGVGPIELVRRTIDVDERFTAVHATHTSADDLAALGAAGASVCICPLTEANLGDGLSDVPAMRDGAVSICLGTDSNARISMLEEMRWLEYGQRLRTIRRGILLDAAGAWAGEALRAGTEAGARSLRLPAGRIATGSVADFCAIDLDAPSLHGWTHDDLLAGLLCGGRDDVVTDVCVGGTWHEIGVGGRGPMGAASGNA